MNDNNHNQDYHQPSCTIPTSALILQIVAYIVLSVMCLALFAGFILAVDENNSNIFWLSLATAFCLFVLFALLLGFADLIESSRKTQVYAEQILNCIKSTPDKNIEEN